jgi:hypothetical protein
MLQKSMSVEAAEYHTAMGQLLLLYTQVDQLIMEICAERIATAPDIAAKLALAKQTGDECRHVQIQTAWMERFGVHDAPPLNAKQQAAIKAHFQALSWVNFLTDMYLCVEALGSEAVEKIVPLADPGTRESLHVPLSDELDHVAFGVTRLKQELATMPTLQRRAYLACIPERIAALTQMLRAFDLDVAALFTAVGVDYPWLCGQLVLRQDELLESLAA